MRMHPASSPLIFEDQLIGTLPFHHAPPSESSEYSKSAGYDRQARQVVDREESSMRSPQMHGAAKCSVRKGLPLRVWWDSGYGTCLGTRERASFRVEGPRGGRQPGKYIGTCTLPLFFSLLLARAESQDYRIGKFDVWVRNARGRFENIRRDPFFGKILFILLLLLVSGKVQRRNGALT